MHFLTAINKLSCAEWIRQFCFALNPSKSLKLAPPLLFLPFLTNPDSDSLSSQNHPSLSDGEEQLERLQQAELTRSKPMSLWKAVTVQAWLEVVMAMPMYIRACSDNVKSGKVMLFVVVVVVVVVVLFFAYSYLIYRAFYFSPYKARYYMQKLNFEIGQKT